MLNAIRVLIQARLRVLRNTLWRGSLRRKVGLIALVALVGLAAFGFYSFVRLVVRGLREPAFAELLAEAAASTPGIPTDLGPYLAAVPAVLLFAALVLLVLSSFGSLLNSLYLSGDMDMLLAAPVPMRAVFAVKFFDALAPLYLLLFALLGSALLGYGQGMGYGPLYTLCALLALLLIPLIPASLASLLVMGVVRVLPARRAREIVGVLGGIVGVLVYLASQFSTIAGPALARPANLSALLASDFPLLPSAWAARALVAAGEGQALPLLVYGGLFIGVSLAIFTGCLALAERLYYDGWSNIATEGGRPKTRNRELRTADGGRVMALSSRFAVLPVQSRAILVKDLRLFFRDLRNLQQLIFPLALAGIWIFQLFIDRPQTVEPDNAPAWFSSFASLTSVGIAFYICLALSSALAGSGISREGKAFWALKLAPITPLRLLLGKFALAYLPYPLVGTCFLILLAVLGGASPIDFLRQLVLLLIAGMGCTAASLGLGALFPRLDWENPQQQTTLRAGCLSTIFFPIYLGLMLLSVGGSGALGLYLGGGITGLSIQLGGWVLASVLTAAICFAAAQLGARGVERIEL